MFKKVKAFFGGMKQRREQKKSGKDMEAYYATLRHGALFLQYIYKDMANQKKNMNLPQKRRMDAELAKKGKFSKEVIARYMVQVNQVNEYIEEEMQKIKKTQVGNLVKKGVAKELAKLEKEKNDS